MPEQRFEKIEGELKELSGKVSHLDKSFAEISVSLSDYVGWVKQLEATIRHLDDTVRDMSNSNQRIPYERISDINKHIEPIKEVLRRHEKDFVKERSVLFAVGIIVFFLGLLGYFVNYVLEDLKSDILAAEHSSKVLILQNSKMIDEHSKVRSNVMNYINEHNKAKEGN